MNKSVGLGLLLFSSIFLGASRAAYAESRGERGSKTIQLLAMPIGFSTYAGSGVKLGLVIDEDLILEASYSGHTSNTSGKAAHVHQYLNLTTRMFPGNSFNLNFGLGVRNYRFNYEAYDDHSVLWDADDTRDGTLITRSRHLGSWFTIGNQWQLRKITVGCDWVGVYVPFLKLEDIDVETSGNNSERSSAAKSKGEELANRLSVIFVNFYMGLAW